MRIVEPSYTILSPVTEVVAEDTTVFDPRGILQLIERAGRVCYKSEGRITDDSADKFVGMIRKRGHESVLEHSSLSVLFVIDRGVSHELVRHRIASFSQESTRYCNYSKGKHGGEITVVRPMWWGEGEAGMKEPQWYAWHAAMKAAEGSYIELVESGANPQQARSVLPNSLKTEVVTTANLREWRHILTLRTSKAAHPQIRQVMEPLLAELKATLPAIFEDI